MRPSLRSKPTLALAALAASALSLGPPAAAQQAPTSEPLAVGATAPDFSVRAATRYGTLEQPVKLSDFAGKTVVLAFFPRARTPGCTIQMHAYRDRYAELFRNGQDVVLVAISMDAAEDLHAWARDDQFQFLMASDVGGAVAEQYGASRGRFADRFLFVIGPDGRVAHRQVPFQEVDPTSYEQLGAALDDVLAGQ
jgi:thioredoxin-dependent peroxiredoxin